MKVPVARSNKFGKETHEQVSGVEYVHCTLSMINQRLRELSIIL